MKKLPTDRELLKVIFDHYHKDFVAYSDENKTRESKIYVPIDFSDVATELGVDKDIVFGRLYYHLNKKYGYKEDDGSLVSLYSTRLGNDRHVVNFPLLAAVLADLEQANFRFLAPMIISIVALTLSIAGFIWNIV